MPAEPVRNGGPQPSRASGRTVSRRTWGRRPPGAPGDVEVVRPPGDAFGWAWRVAGAATLLALGVETSSWVFSGDLQARENALFLLGLFVSGLMFGPLVGRRTYAFAGTRMWRRDLLRRWAEPVDLQQVRAVGAIVTNFPYYNAGVLFIVDSPGAAPLRTTRVRNLFDAATAERFGGVADLRILQVGNPKFLGNRTLSRFTRGVVHGRAHITMEAARALRLIGHGPAQASR
jgi:hypothetical protein